MKYVFITGGVASSLGKGVTAAALGCPLKARGYRCLLYTSWGAGYSTQRAQWPNVVSKAAGAQDAPESSAA